MARRQTPYYHKLADLGAEFVERLDFAVALRVTTTEAEHLATREAVGLFDVMYQGVVLVAGREALPLLQSLTVNNLARLVDGSGLYSSMLNDRGGIIDDLTIFRHDEQRFWVCPTPSRTDAIAAWIDERAVGRCAHVTNITSGTAYLSVQGPRSRATLQKLTDSDISGEALPFYRFTGANVAGVPTVISRTGYSGELGYELFYPRDYAEFMWDAVMQAGQEFGIAVCGLACLSSLGLEKKYPLYGRDLDDTTTSWEADLGWTVRLDKGDFVGRSALLESRDQPLRRVLAGLAFEGTTFVPKAGASVTVDGRTVGHITTAGIGYAVRRSLALAFLEPEHARAGNRVTVDDEGVTSEGSVYRQAFYDPERTRLRS